MESLSDKIFRGRKILSIYHHNKDMVLAKHIKEKVQNAERRLKEILPNTIQTLESSKTCGKGIVLDPHRIIDEIFKEEFGQKLT